MPRFIDLTFITAFKDHRLYPDRKFPACIAWRRDEFGDCIDLAS
jgi:hypothetical protein